MYEHTAKFLNQEINQTVFERLNDAGQAFLKLQEASLREIRAAGGDPERVDPRALLRSALQGLKLRIPAEGMFMLGRDDNFEIWSADRKLLAAGNRTLNRLSYPIYDWFQRDWVELFARDTVSEAKIVGAWIKLAAGAAIVTDVCDYHIVAERGARYQAAWVKVKAVCTAYSTETGEACASIGITNIQDVPTHLLNERTGVSFPLSQ